MKVLLFYIYSIFISLVITSSANASENLWVFQVIDYTGVEDSYGTTREHEEYFFIGATKNTFSVKIITTYSDNTTKEKEVTINQSLTNSTLESISDNNYSNDTCGKSDNRDCFTEQAIYAYILNNENEGAATFTYTTTRYDSGSNIVLTRDILLTYKMSRITEQTASVQTTAGTSFSITSTDAGLLTTSDTTSDIGALLTLEDSSTTIQRDDGGILEIKQNAIVTLNPESISLIRGEVITTVACNYEVYTALATITSCPTIKKGADSVKFTTSYSQSGLDGTLKVSVETGTVDVVDREGNTHTVTAGNEKTITSRVPRTQWVLPIDEDKLYGGKDNFLIWTQFPDAASYQMEFNLPTPDFAENNVSVPQFTKQVIPLTGYIEFEGLALLTLPLPKGADGLVLELRIFALDANDNIIGESVSSDSTKATLTD